MMKIFRRALLTSLPVLGLLSTNTLAQSVQAVSSGGSSLLALGYNASTDENFVASISTTTGATSPVKDFKFSGGGGWYAFAASGDHAYAISADGHLYDVDVSSGSLSTVSIDPSLQDLATSGSTLLALRYNSSPGNFSLASINAATGASTLIRTFTFSGGGYFSGTFAALGNEAYVLSSDHRLYEINLLTGADSMVTLNPSVESLTASGSSLFALGYNTSLADNYLASVNVTTGATSIISNFSLSGGGYFSGTFSALGDEAYVVSNDDHLYQLNVLSGAVTTLPGFGQAVTTPEPSTWTLLLLGSGFLGWVKVALRRKSSSTAVFALSAWRHCKR
jgi:PEP-CTERM motif